MIDDRRSHFEAAWPWLQAALDSYPLRTHDKAHVWHAIATGDAQLWTCETAALVTEISVYPTGLRILNVWLAGGDMAGVKRLETDIAQFGRGRRCDAITFQGREGWVRALDGYGKAALVIFKRLDA